MTRSQELLLGELEMNGPIHVDQIPDEEVNTVGFSKTTLNELVLLNKAAFIVVRGNNKFVAKVTNG